MAMFYSSPKQLAFKKIWRARLENVAQLNAATFGMGVDEATQHGAGKTQGNLYQGHVIPHSRVSGLSVG